MGIEIDGVKPGIELPTKTKASGQTGPVVVLVRTQIATETTPSHYDCLGMSGVVVDLTISATATVTWEVLMRDSNWRSVIALNIATGATGTTATASGTFWVPTAGFKQMRARVSAYSSGTVDALAVGYYGSPPYTIALQAQLIAGEDLTNNLLRMEGGTGAFGSGSNRATADVQIKSAARFLHSVSFAPTTATPTAGLVSIYDSLTESGTVLYSEWFFATDPGHTIILDVPYSTGLYVGYDATAANLSVTVVGR